MSAKQALAPSLTIHIQIHRKRCASFDAAKQASNLKKHRLDLADAQAMIESGLTVTFEDRRFEYSEERLVTLGPLGGSLVAIVTAEAEGPIRVISMRKANRHDQAVNHENLH